MNEREIIKQLHNLKNLQPDAEWKNSNRDILLSQISGQSTSIMTGEYMSGWSMLAGFIADKTKARFAQPAWLAAVIILVFSTGIISTVYVGRNTKPGDSFYIAKMISEKAQLAITFSEKDKAKLGMVFAGNRAKEITQVLAEPTNDKAGQDAQVKKLESDFRKEISTVISRLEKTKVIKTAKATQPKTNQPAIDPSKTAASGKPATGESEVFGANIGKDGKRLEISDPVKPQQVDPVPTSTAPDPGNVAKVQTQSQSTSTKEIQPEIIEKSLHDAETLLIDKKDVNGTLEKLNQINDLIVAEEAKNVTAQAEKDATSTK
jgi:hypothetical protein